MSSLKSFSKKIVCFVLSLVMLLTCTINGLFFNISAFARNNGDSTLLTNYDFSNSNYVSAEGGQQRISDTMNTSRQMKTDGWSSTSFNNGSDVFVQNGFISGDMSGIYGESSYRIEFKYSKSTNDALDATVISLGTANPSAYFSEGDAANVMHLHQDGTLVIAGSNKGAIPDLAMKTNDDRNYYTIQFNAYSKTLIISRDSKISYTAALSDSEVERFKSVQFCSLGAQASDWSYGCWVGALNCHYYYLRAYREPDYPQTVDAIKVDPVIYTHGDANYENIDYGYMMYGKKISSANVKGEQYTSFILPQGAVIDSITAGEDDNIDYTYKDNKYILTGSFEADSFRVQGKDTFVDLKFTYSLNSKKYIEYHRFCVKTNPVPTHAMIYTQSYTSVTQGGKSAVAFQTVALGSTGSLEQSIAKGDGWAGGVSHTYFANSWNIYEPYDSNHSATSSSSGSLDNALVNKSSSSPVEKVAGFGVTGSRNGAGGSNRADIGIESEIAEYYVDKSADGILGVNHNAGESAYSFDLLTANIYQNYNTNNGTVHITSHDFYGDSGYPWLNVKKNSNWWEESPGVWKNYNIWDNNQKGSETITLSGSTNDGDVLGNYWTSAECYTGNQVKATLIMKIKVNVFDKSNARNAYKNATARFNSNYYNSSDFPLYAYSKLIVEGQLADYQNRNVSNDDVNNMQTLYNSLGSACDYSALNAAIKQSKYVLDKGSVYESVEELRENYNSVLSQAFDSNDISDDLTNIERWTHRIYDQIVVDSLVTMLQFEYTETVVNKSNLDIDFNVYVDGELVSNGEYHPGYRTDLTVNVADHYSNANNYSVSKWTFGGQTVATDGYSYTMLSKLSGTLSCYLVSTPSSNNTCKVTLYDFSNRKEIDYFVGQDETYADVIAVAKINTDTVPYYYVSGWEINGTSTYNINQSLNGVTQLEIKPVYSPTVSDYSINVSGGSLSTENGFDFDSRAYITYDDKGDFLCWAVRFDNDTYRVASYNSNYTFNVSGNMQFVAITTENFDAYKNKLQKYSTDTNNDAQTVSFDMLKSRAPIPSIRGVAEDSSSISGAVWNSVEHKLYVVAQVADGAFYDSCGLVLTYRGKTLVTNSVSQTKSGQYMVTYNLGSSTTDRELKIMSFAKKDDNMLYSPNIDVTIPADNQTVDISNDYVALKYDSKSGLYSIIENNTVVLNNVSAEYKIGKDGPVYNLSSYPTHSYKKQAIKDNAGEGEKLTVTSKKSGMPIVEQVFKIYKDKPYVLTDISIKNENGYEISSNYMAPVVVSGNESFMNGNEPWTTFLYTPIDNDSWSRFKTYSLTDGGNIESHEVSAIYKPDTREGLVVGSVTHDHWKTAVKYEGGNKGISSLKAYGGARTIEISSDNQYRGEETHGAVKGSVVKSPTIFIGNYSNWQDGMMEFTEANTDITPMRTEGDLGGVPFGWNSWGSIADSLTYENATGNINKIKELYQHDWETDINGNMDGTPVVMDLDSWWNEIKAYDGADNEATMRAYVAECRKNGQIPGIYHTPFVHWASESQMNDPNESWWTHPERVLRKSDGTMYGPFDGGYPLDVTRPDVIQDMVNRIRQFKEWGFEYVKIDFLSHGMLEGDFYNKDITTGMEAYNYAMGKIIEEANKGYGTQLFINLSIAPLFPYHYANGRRMGCDSWYSTDNTQYTLNQLTYGFWERGIYKYPDPDHAMIYGRDGKATEGQARNVMTLNAAVAGNMLLGDSFVDYKYGSRTYSANGCINRANSALWNKEIIEVAKKNRTFRSQNKNTNSYSNVYRMDDDNGDIYYAVFNFGGTNKYFLEDLPTEHHYKITELWSGDVVTDYGWAWIEVQLSGETSKIYKCTRVD